jgi:hypothetical protein
MVRDEGVVIEQDGGLADVAEQLCFTGGVAQEDQRMTGIGKPVPQRGVSRLVDRPGVLGRPGKEHQQHSSSTLPGGMRDTERCAFAAACVDDGNMPVEDHAEARRRRTGFPPAVKVFRDNLAERPKQPVHAGGARSEVHGYREGSPESMPAA